MSPLPAHAPEKPQSLHQTSPEQDANRDEQPGDSPRSNYYRLFSILAVSFAIMYAAMWANVYRFDHVYLNLTQVYMALVMVTPMAVLMLAIMGRMFRNKRANAVIVGACVFVFVSAVALLRAQTFVGDGQYIRRMIPHHSQAINNSRRAALTNPELRRLAEEIIASQEREIAEMKAILARIGGAENADGASETRPPQVSSRATPR